MDLDSMPDARHGYDVPASVPLNSSARCTGARSPGRAIREAPRPLGIAARLYVLCLGVVLTWPAVAQFAPDAGTTLRELKPRDLDLPGPPPQPVEAPPPSPVTAGDTTVRFRVDAYRYSGNRQIDAAELDAVAADATGRDLSLTDVQEVALRITRHYRARGYLVARAYVPPQEVRDGRVEIAVLEGHYGAPELANTSSVKDAVLTRHLARIEANRVIARDALDRRLLLIRDLGGVGAVTGTLRPGEETGESTLRVEVSPAPRVSGEVTADNYGNRFVGRYRLGGAVDVASPFGLGDLLDVRVLTSGEELQSGRLGYRVPLGVDGLTLHSSFTAVHYALKDDFAPLRAQGSALQPSMSLSYPLIRLPRLNLYVRGGADYTSLRDDTDNPPTAADRALWSLFGGVSGDWRDGVGGGAISTFSATVEAGELDIESAALARLDRATTRAAGAYQKFTWSLLRLQSLGGPVSLYASLNGQFALHNLDSAEKFWLGGATGVRAYPQGEAAGDDGYLANIELRWNLPVWRGVQPQLLAFVDTGGVKLDHDPFTPGDPYRFLSGAGLGVNLFESHGIALRAAWAWQIGPEDAQADKDRSGRGWILLGKTF